MIRTLRAFFLGCGLREKILLVGLVTLFVLVWTSNFSHRAGDFWSQKKRTTATLKDQQNWLSNQATIEAKAQKSAGQFDAVSTLDATRLYSAMGQLATDAGLKAPGLGENLDQPGGQFILHSLRVTLNQAEWDAFLKFYRSFEARSPYIGMDQFTMLTDPSNRSHNVTLRVSSVEVIH